MSPLAQAGLHTGFGALSGLTNAAITGGDVGQGILTGGLSAGLAKFGGGYIPSFDNKVINIAAQFTGRSLLGGVTGGIARELYGGGFGEWFIAGMQTAAVATGANWLLHGPLLSCTSGKAGGLTM